MNKIKKALKSVGLNALYAFVPVWNLPKTIKRKLFDGTPTAISKRAVALSLAVIMIATMIPLSGTIANAADDTAAQDIVLNAQTNTYEIYTAKGLCDFRDKVNGGDTAINAKLMKDIDLSTVCGANLNGVAVNWTPIGTDANSYNGTFDGNGKAITHIYIDDTLATNQGLFGFTYNNSIIKNLSASGSISSESNIGGIVYVNQGLIESCSFSGNLTAVFGFIGGISKHNSGTIKNCVNSATITSKDTAGEVGGIVGTNAGVVENCINTGAIIAENSENIGGIVGTIVGNFILKNCYNTGSVTGKNKVGGVVGRVWAGKIVNCYNTGEVTATLTENPVFGGIAGYFETTEVTTNKIINSYYLNSCVTNGNNLDGATPKTAAEMQTSDFVAALNGTDSAFHADIENMNNGYPVLKFQLSIPDGKGTETTPYLIYTVAEMVRFGKMVNSGETTACAKLMNDIDLSTVCGANLNGEVVNWTPIGTTFESNEYGGTFDGQGFTISNLYINSPKEREKGLFGYTDTNSIIKNLSASGSISSQSNIGGIAIVNEGLVENCSFSGNLTVDLGYIGGIARSNYGTIKNCVNSATITCTGTGEQVGGIVGTDAGLVENCINTGAVIAENAEAVGGIVGTIQDDGTIKNCYNTGSVAGKNKVGGVGGKLWAGQIENCYNIGSVSGTTSFGGVAGYFETQFDTNKITNSYYLDSCVTNGVALDGASAKKADEMKTADFVTTLNGTDSAFTQDIVNMNNGYPVLAFQLPTLGGDGTAETPYLIYTAEELEFFGKLVNAGKTTICAKLMNDIDLSSVCGADVGGAAVNWTPIGTDTYQYGGTFDGQGFTISNLYINAIDEKEKGLFGYTSTNSIIKNLSVSGSISSKSLIGGIVSYNGGLIERCSFNGELTAAYGYIGGIAYFNYGTIKNCVNYATITFSGKFSEVGGIVSNNRELVENCINTGEINAENAENVGGIVGKIESRSTLKNCYNTGSVTGKNNVGGVCGNLFAGQIENCYNTGAVTATLTEAPIFGGVAGYFGTQLATNKITNSYYLDTCVTDGIALDGVSAKTENAFNSGEVAKLLGDVFGQTIKGDTTDRYPVFRAANNSNQVLSVGFKVAGGEVTDNAYTNSGYTVTIPDAYTGYTNMTDENNTAFTSQTLVTKDLTVTAIPAPAYTVTIPAKADFGDVERKLEKASDRYKKVEDLTVSAKTSYLFANKKELSVTLSSDFVLTSGENKLAYEVYDKNNTSVSTDSIALATNYTEYDTDKVTTAEFYAMLDQSKIRVDGKYTGVLTFTVTLEDIA